MGRGEEDGPQEGGVVVGVSLDDDDDEVGRGGRLNEAICCIWLGGWGRIVALRVVCVSVTCD